MPLRGPDATVTEDPRFLSRQLITYLGNKRSLLPQIANAVEHVRNRLGKDRLRMFDAFAGSGVVSRLFKSRASYLASNDLEDYAAVTARCYLTNRSAVDLHELAALADQINQDVARAPLPPGFIRELYAPHDEGQIGAQERVFYTPENARRLDDYRRRLETLPPLQRQMLLGPLLSRASVHANTAGVFKGFYKDRYTRVGRFGGSHADALRRIRGAIELEPPVLSRFECEVDVFQEDANRLARRLKNLDLAYFDPPYNQHPYGSNYFMLNLVVCYQRPQSISRVSGIPVDWKRSEYNVRGRSLSLLKDLVHTTDARFLLVSFNDEGFVHPHQMHELLQTIGAVEVVQMQYNAFRGSRNLRQRKIHVTERLFLVERR